MATPEAMSLSSVCKGFHDLQNFVHDSWSDYVIGFMRLHSLRKQEIAKADLRLLDQFKILRRTGGDDGYVETDAKLSRQQLEQVSSLEHLPEIQDLVQRYLGFRASLRSESML